MSSIVEYEYYELAVSGIKVQSSALTRQRKSSNPFKGMDVDSSFRQSGHIISGVALS